MKRIQDLKNLRGVKVLLRLDLNVPIQNGKIVDDYRIRKALATIDFLKKQGARTVIISHIEGDGGKTLQPVAEYLSKKYPLTFIENYRNAFAASQALADGEFIMLENLRMNEGEKKNDQVFAKELASLADIYVNEAFSVSHRAHASVVAVTQFLPSYAGIQFMYEITNISKAFNPARPFLFILGGAKFDTKLPLIEKFMDIADTIFVGGALANNFFAEKGMNIGNSLISPDNFNLKRFFNNEKLLLPIDVVIKNGDKVEVKMVADVKEGDVMLDDGPATIKMLKERIQTSALVLWNGTLGAYEHGFKDGTLELAKILATSSVESILGGGDTLAAIAELDIEDKMSFVSTGGGAMLDYLANETLPGIQALEKSKL